MPGWHSCPFFNRLDSFRALDFLDRCLWIFSAGKTDGLSLFLAAAWYAWSYINLLFHGGSSAIPNLWAQAETFLRNFSLASLSPKVPGAPSQRAKCFNGLIEAETAELLAILEGVHLAISENLNPVIVEFDAFNAINLCSGKSLSRCEVDNIAQDVQDFIRESTNNISLCFSPRSCNLVAHNVAKWAIGNGSSIFWISSFPNWLCKQIKDDSCINLSAV
ncbi:hypothetical protein LWI28_006261 [Acer negundo]|uniref:RNase H type-1 domain-containing protein n=1 Tax=Acer negundo TaxID=4023 RepID=A0AAD5IHK6_ACENE|nr:hypothetical protein LWI28_006261 [Acer negundo]